MQIITNQFQKELKKHGSDHFPFLVSYQRLSEYDSNSFMWHYLKKLFSANPWTCLLANVILIANNKTEQISNVWGGFFL